MKSNGKVSVFQTNCYTGWRRWNFPELELREGDAAQPGELLLQKIWQHQRILRHELKLFDGTPFQVLHPGFLNRESGPDFKGAVLQRGNEGPETGDVEIDLQSRGWDDHRHRHNPEYKRVILHVVWDKPASQPPLPTLHLGPVLDAPLEELRSALSGGLSSMPDALLGQCFVPLQTLSRDAWRDLLRQSAQSRLEAKTSQLGARARQAGWEQALWEGTFGALGYKRNVWPMRRLAELIPLLLQTEPDQKLTPKLLQARLLGLAGLLPPDLSRAPKHISAYLRSAWDLWWRERDRFEQALLPKTLWSFHGLRPANHPQRRLALAAHWLSQGRLPDQLEGWIAERIPLQQLAPSLLEKLQVPLDDFWSHHWTLRSAPFEAPQPLLGPQRLTDLAMNVFLPWLWVRAKTGNNRRLLQETEFRYFNWPKAEDNSVLRQARRRLFGESCPRPETAADQQGLLQIVRDFCQQSNALCQNCPFPELIRSIVPEK